MRVIVTGSHGFIGRNLVAALERQGHDITCFDTKIGKDLFRKWPQVDYVYHLACINQEEALNKKTENIRVNAEGTQFAVEMAEKMNARFIYTSTASVYGQASILPTPVDALLLPQSDYAVAKLAGEYFVKKSSANWTIFRLSNVYGPGQSTDNPYCGVVAKFIQASEHNTPHQIYGTGYQTRDFTYIDDVIDALLAWNYNKTTLNISHGEEISINDLSVAISRACGDKPSNFRVVPRPIDGIQRRWLKSDIKCPTPLGTGLLYTIKWYKEHELRREKSPRSTEESRSEVISG